MAVESPPRRKRRFLFILSIVAALAFGPPLLTLNRFQRRVESAMSAALGRTVSVRKVHPLFLPRPGFYLQDMTVQDDPAFGSEPLLHADGVTASLRLTSLWRGRIEIATLDLENPSLNLVRGADGRWNLEPLLMHASEVPTAPSSRRTPEARPRFPYIEANGGRINFKNGNEKKVFALSDADFALWLASEQEWGMRLAARPMRTDADLGDTGTLKLSGRLQRATALRQASLHLNLAWQNAQLGQFTQLIYGRDRGWRGRIDSEGTLSGKPTALNIALKVSVDDFRRYDIASADSFNAEVGCEGMFVSGSNLQSPALRGNCSLERNRGVLAVSGEYLPQSRNGDFTLTAAALPVSMLLDLARHVKRDVAADLSAQGTLEGRMSWRGGRGSIQPVSQRDRTWTFTAQANLASPTLGRFNLGTLVLKLDEMTSRRAQAADDHRAVVTLLPVQVSLGGTLPVVATGVISAHDYDFGMKGEAELSQLQNFFSLFGLPQPAVDGSATGRAKIDLHVSGQWLGFPAPLTVGSVRMTAPSLAKSIGSK